MACGVALLAAAPLAAQDAGPRAYYLNVGAGSRSSAWSAGGVSDFQRLRLMASAAPGRWRFEAAYEHTLLLQQRAGAQAAALTPGATATPGDWLDLDWTVLERGHAVWRHRADRLNAAYQAGRAEARVGRQTVSWATTLFLTPADPFAPFDPSDPFREYRAGVDAARLQLFPGPFSSVDVVVRPSRTPLGRAVTALARGKLTVASWDLSGWGGVLYDEAAAAAAATRTVGGAALRAEVSVRRSAGGGATLRAAVGADRRWTVLDRDLYVVLEYQHDGFGAARAADLAAVGTSAPYRRGEMQVLGRDVAALQAQYQLHPLLGGSVLVLANLRDGSAVVAPALSYSASNEIGLRAGVFLGLGEGAVDALTGPRSEYGAVPTSAYASLSIFF